MKRVILSAIAVFAFGFANAQQVNYGVKVGGNLTNLRVDAGDVGTVVFKSNVGFQGGAFAEIKVADKFAVQPEALFSYESSEISGADFNLSYINVPVMAKYYASEKISLQVGPQIGFLVGAKAKMDGEKEDIKDDLATTNFGLNFGLGYNFTEKVAVDFRYNVGLTDIAEDSFEGGKMKLSGFSLAVGYKF
ncbi:OMP b-brl 2 multi-domain protein [Flavobacterium daejeonense]|nr:OMP b-brl 2 multi-domain protein [Flavobacterium daejeonense]